MSKKKSEAARSSESQSPLIDAAFEKVMREIRRIEKAMADGTLAVPWRTKAASKGARR